MKREEFLNAVIEILGQELYDQLVKTNTPFILLYTNAAVKCFIDQRPEDYTTDVLRQGIIILSEGGYLKT